MGRTSTGKLVKLPPHPPTITREEVVEKAQEAYDLRLQGLTYKQIGTKLGIDESTAQRRCNVITAWKIKELITKDDALKQEVNDKLDELFSRWMPLAMSKDLEVGVTKIGANDREYDILLPAWEASSGATKHVLEILREKIRVNGLAPKEQGGGGKFSPQETGEMAAAMFAAMRKLAGTTRTIQAEVVNGKS